MRKAEARSREALVEAMGKALDGSPPQTQEVSLSTADTALRVNYFEPRCKTAYPTIEASNAETGPAGTNRAIRQNLEMIEDG